MPIGAVFSLIINDGKKYRLLVEKKYLYARLQAISNYRRSNGLSESPTVADIEKTHVLYINASYKPFVHVASEYRKEIAPGQYTLGDEVRFDIKHFGDFFADMIVHIKIDLNDVIEYGTDYHNDNRPLLRWCDYPGERILQETSFEVNSTVIDSYGPDDSVVYRNFHLPINKRRAYDVLMGQEVTEDAFLSRDHVHVNADGSLDQRVKVQIVKGLQTPKFDYDRTVDLYIPLKFWFNESFRQAIPSVAMPTSKRIIKVKLATFEQLIGIVPRGDQEIYENAYSRDSDFIGHLGESLVNSGGVLNKSNVVIRDMELWVNHLFVDPQIHNIYISRVGFSLVRVHKNQSKIVSNPREEHKMNDLKWPIETMYIGMKPLEVTSTDKIKLARYLDRWDKFTLLEKKYHNVIEGVYDSFSINGIINHELEFVWNNGELNKSQLIFSPVVALALGSNFKYGSKHAAAWYNAVNKEHLAFNFSIKSVSSNVITLRGRYPDYAKHKGYDPLFGSIRGIINANTSSALMSQAPLRAINYQSIPLIDSIKIAINSVDVVDNMQSKFLNVYVPFKYGGYNVNPPLDIGLNMITFALHPGQYQPSGYINMSRAKDIYLLYQSSTIGMPKKSDTEKVQKGVLYVFTKAINFLLISDGSAVLRYIT